MDLIENDSEYEEDEFWINSYERDSHYFLQLENVRAFP